MSLSNELINSLYTGITVRCSFDPPKEGAEQNRNDVTADWVKNPGRLYTYKTFFKDLAPGDSVLVTTPNGVVRSVTVVEIGDETILDPQIEYKWVMSKCEFPEYETVMQKQQELRKKIESLKRDNARKQLLANLGLNDDDVMLLSNISSTSEGVGSANLLERK